MVPLIPACLCFDPILLPLIPVGVRFGPLDSLLVPRSFPFVALGFFCCPWLPFGSLSLSLVPFCCPWFLFSVLGSPLVPFYSPWFPPCGLLGALLVLFCCPWLPMPMPLVSCIWGLLAGFQQVGRLCWGSYASQENATFKGPVSGPGFDSKLVGRTLPTPCSLLWGRDAFFDV